MVIDGLDKLDIPIASVDKKLDMELGVNGGEIDLTPAQRDALQALTEDAVIGGLLTLFTTPEFERLSTQEKKEDLKERITNLRAKARAEFRQQVTPAARPSSFTPNAFSTPTGRSSGWGEVFQAAR